MAIPSTSETVSNSEPPLWSIAIAVIVILGTPLVLYSFAPAGPIRQGDTVFSEGEQHVEIHQAATDPLDKLDTCLLDPNSPLIVVHFPNTDTDGSIIAQVQGNPASEWPFCPLHAEVVIKTHQVFQKPTVFGTVRELLIGLLSR